ncbi:MAG TPA: phage major capsid protein [Sphingomicrobium sp.]|jgi:HK97 family phage major capsid protein|nr:phage major capsid protein [Sphingomicrobium sp.]
MTYQDIDFAALKAHARKLGHPLTNCDAELNTAGWATLHGIRSGARKAARATLDAIKGSESEEELAANEKRHEELMSLFDAVQAEIEDRDANGQREPLTHTQRGAPVPGDGEAPAYFDGAAPAYVGSRSGWSDREGREIRVLAPSDSFATRSRYDGPSLGAMLRAMVTGPRNDAERRALAEGTDSAGGYTVPDPLASHFIDRLRAASVTIRAGARTVPMTSDTLSIARLESDPDMGWRAENAAITESDPTFGRVAFQAHSLAGLVRCSRELLEDSVNVEAMLENAFVQATALAFDVGCLYGTGPGNNQPTGLGNISGIASVSMGNNGAALTNYDKIIDTIYELQLANAGDPSAMIYHPRTGAALAKLKDSQNNPLTVPEMVAKVPKLVTTSVPIDQTQGTSTDASSILTGDFKRMLIGLRNSLRIEILKERYADVHQYGFVAFMRGDMQVEHKAAFAKLVGIR